MHDVTYVMILLKLSGTLQACDYSNWPVLLTAYTYWHMSNNIIQIICLAAASDCADLSERNRDCQIRICIVDNLIMRPVHHDVAE